MKTQTNNTINYNQLIKRNDQLNQLRKEGFMILPKRNLKVLGYALIGVGVITFFIPLTTLPLLIIGFGFLGISYYKLKDNTLRKLRVLKNRYF